MSPRLRTYSDRGRRRWPAIVETVHGRITRAHFYGRDKGDIDGAYRDAREYVEWMNARPDRTEPPHHD